MAAPSSLLKTRNVTLVSSECRRSFPNNTPSAFRNTLEQHVRASPGKRLYVRPVSISLSLDVMAISRVVKKKKYISLPGCINILLDELTAQRFGENYVQTVGSFPFPPPSLSSSAAASVKGGDIYAQHKFENADFLMLDKSEVADLGVKLVDSRFEPVTLASYLPTVLQLEVTEDDEMAAGQGIVTLGCTSWNAKGHFKWNNKLHSFTSPLPSMMTFPNHEVALASIVYPPLMVQSKTVTFSLESFSFTVDLSKFEYGKKDLQHHEIVGALNEALDRHFYGKNFQFRETFRVGQSRESNSVGVSISPKRFQFFPGSSERKHRRGQRITRLWLGKNFRDMLGSADEVYYILPRDHKNYRPTLLGDRWADISLSSGYNPTALLECSIAMDSPVGDSRFKVLEFVPVLTSPVGKMEKVEWIEQKELVYTPPTRTFVNMSAAPFNSIKFRFLEPDGEPKSFLCQTPPWKRKRNGEEEEGDEAEPMIIINLVVRPKRELV